MGSVSWLPKRFFFFLRFFFFFFSAVGAQKTVLTICSDRLDFRVNRSVANPRLIKGAFSALELERLVSAERVLQAEAALKNKSTTAPSFGVLADRLGGHRSDVQTRYAWLKLQKSRANAWLADEDRVLVRIIERPDERSTKSFTWCVVASAVSAAKLTPHARTALCCRERVELLLATPALFRSASQRYADASVPLPTMEQLAIAPDSPLPSSEPWIPTDQQIVEAQKRLIAAQYTKFAQPADGAPSSSSLDRGDSASPPHTPNRKRAYNAKRMAPMTTITNTIANKVINAVSSTPLSLLDGKAMVTPWLDPTLSGSARRAKRQATVDEEEAAEEEYDDDGGNVQRSSSRRWRDAIEDGKRKRKPSWRVREGASTTIKNVSSSSSSLQSATTPSAAVTAAASTLAALAAFVEDQFFTDDVDEDEVPLARLSVPMELPLPPSLLSRARRLLPPPSLFCDEQPLTILH
jgi:hypothetical protein